MEQTITRAQRRMASFDREISRMEKDPSRVRSSQIDRSEEKIADIEESLSNVDAGFAGLQDVVDELSQFKQRLQSLRNTQNAPTPSAAASPSASASPTDGDLSPSQLRAIEGKVSKVERAIASLSRTVESYLTEPLASAQRLQNNAMDKLADARNKLNEIMEIASDRAEPLKAQLDDFAQKIENRVAEFGAASDTRDEMEKRIEEMRASGEYTQKMDEIQSLTELATQFATLQMQSNIFIATSGSPQIIEEMQSWEALTSQFINYSRQHIDPLKVVPGGNALVVLGQSLEDKINRANEHLAGLEENMQTTFEEHFSDVLDFARTSEKEGRFSVFGSRENMINVRTIEADMLRPPFWLEFYKAMPNSNPAKARQLEKMLEDTTSQIDVMRENLRESIIAANRLRDDAYTGDDRNKLIELAEAGWRTIHGDIPILETRILSAQWSRHTGQKYNKPMNRVEDYDFSTIDAFVIEKSSDSVVTFWLVELQIRHMEQDAMISNPASRHRTPPRPYHQMLLENL